MPAQYCQNSAIEKGQNAAMKKGSAVGCNSIATEILFAVRFVIECWKMDSRAPFTLSGELGLRREEIDKLGPWSDKAERRLKARVRYAFPTRAYGTDAQGQSFEFDCALDNISSSGLYLRMPGQLKPGIDLNVVVKFADGSKPGATAVLFCEVLRDEVQADGGHGIAMTIKNYHFVEPVTH